MTTDVIQSQAKFLRAISHPMRLAILGMLRHGEECVCHMEATLGVRQAYVSQQLAVLREAGLVQDRRDGWNVYYWTAKPEVYAVLDAARAVLGEPAVEASERITGAACPCPKCNSTLERGAA